MGSLFGNPSNASSSGASAEGSLVIGAWVNHSHHMSKKMTASDIKAKIFAVLDGVAAGDEVEITKHGRIVAKLVPARGGAGAMDAGRRGGERGRGGAAGHHGGRLEHGVTV